MKFKLGDIVAVDGKINEHTISKVVGLKYRNVDKPENGIEYLCQNLFGYGSSYYYEQWLIPYKEDLISYYNQSIMEFI